MIFSEINLVSLKKYQPSVVAQVEGWTPGSDDKPADVKDVEKVCSSIQVFHQSLPSLLLPGCEIKQPMQQISLFSFSFKPHISQEASVPRRKMKSTVNVCIYINVFTVCWSLRAWLLKRKHGSSALHAASEAAANGSRR